MLHFKRPSKVSGNSSPKSYILGRQQRYPKLFSFDEIDMGVENAVGQLKAVILDLRCHRQTLVLNVIVEDGPIMEMAMIDALSVDTFENDLQTQ